MEIKRIELGESGFFVSEMGIGTWAWGDKIFWGFGKGYNENDIQKSFVLCLNNGIDFYDTAEIYGWGKSEKFLGKFVRQSGKDVFIATKFMPFPWKPSKSFFRKALDRSLSRLGVKNIGLYQIHFPLPPISIETWMEEMARAVHSGKIKAVGVSNYSASQMRRAYSALEKHGIHLASNQIEYSLLCRDPENNGIIDACRELHVTPIAYSPIAMGVLSGKYRPGKPPGGLRRMSYRNGLLKKTIPLLDKLFEIGKSHGAKTRSQVAINWVLCKGMLPIPGVKKTSQAIENLGALGWKLSNSEIAELDATSSMLLEKR